MTAIVEVKSHYKPTHTIRAAPGEIAHGHIVFTAIRHVTNCMYLFHRCVVVEWKGKGGGEKLVWSLAEHLPLLFRGEGSAGHMQGRWVGEGLILSTGHMTHLQVIVVLEHLPCCTLGVVHLAMPPPHGDTPTLKPHGTSPF